MNERVFIQILFLNIQMRMYTNVNKCKQMNVRMRDCISFPFSMNERKEEKKRRRENITE